MNVIQYGDQYGVFTAEGDLVEGGFASRREANEARERMTSDVEPADDERVEKVVNPKRQRKGK